MSQLDLMSSKLTHYKFDVVQNIPESELYDCKLYITRDLIGYIIGFSISYDKHQNLCKESNILES